MTSRLTPQIRPVEIVVPERDRPGATAKACPRPTAKACQYEIPLRYSFAVDPDFLTRETPLPEAISEKNRRTAVTSKAMATPVIEPKRLST